MTRKEEIIETIQKLQNELKIIQNEEYETDRHQRWLNNKYCAICKNRDKEKDFRIPEGIVCTHPSNQSGKDRFKCYSQTCKFWEKED